MNKALRQRLQTACAQHPKCTVAVLMHSVPGASETVCASVRCLRALVSAWFNMSSSICAAGVPQNDSRLKNSGMVCTLRIDRHRPTDTSFAGLASTRSTCLPALQSTWLASGSAANPFAVPVPASSINPSWLASPENAPQVDGSDR